MIITESNLRTLIRDEIKLVLLEKKIENGAISEGRFETFTIALAVGALGSLAVMQKSHDDKVSARVQASAAQAAEKLSSKDYHLKVMDKQLRNAAAHMWSTSEEGREYFPTYEFKNSKDPRVKGKKFQVLPPEYAIYDLVLDDKKNDNPRFGIPESPEEKDRLIANIKTLRNQTSNQITSAEKVNFFKKFNKVSQYELASTVTPGLQSFGDPTIRAIVPSVEVVLKVYANTPLPLKAMTAKDYYNAVYWGEHMTTEDYELIASNAEEFDPETELHPGLIKKTREKAARLGMPADTFQWKEQKNREKKLA